jgi:serine protease Do
MSRLHPSFAAALALVVLPVAAQAQARSGALDGAPTVVLDVPAVVDSVNEAIVSIEVAHASERGGGTGIVVDKAGLIVTNFHVIAANEQGFPDPAKPQGPVKLAQSISVRMADGRVFVASVKGFDRATDIALLSVTPGDKPLPEARLGDSDRLRVGEWVIAIGNPLGFEHTVTLGIVSGKGRVGLGGQFDDFIQTDAAINYGNSGGPLVNARGEVVAINTLFVDKGKGLGFAIPINLVREIVPQLSMRGRVQRGTLGVELFDTTASLRQRLSLPTDRTGIIVGRVGRGTPAARAGLRQWDFITALDRSPVVNNRQFNRAISDRTPGTVVEITFLREGREYTVKAEVAAEESPAPGAPAEAPASRTN